MTFRDDRPIPATLTLSATAMCLQGTESNE